MRNKRNPFYPDDTDYNTNSPSYYDDLARKNKLIQLLAEKIWDYDERLDERLDDLENVLQNYLSQWDTRIENLDDEVSHIFVTWLNDGTLEQIINNDVLGNKADKSYVDDLNENVTSQLAHTEQYLSERGINVSEFGELGVGDDRPIIQEAIDYAEENNISNVFLPPIYMNINSEHPTRGRIGIYLPQHIRLIGAGTNRTRIYTTIRLDKLVELGIEKSKTGGHNHLKHISLYGVDGVNWDNILVETAISTPDGIGTGGHYFDCVNLYSFNVGFDLDTWTSFFNQCVTHNTEIGFSLSGGGTSNVFTSCGANGAKVSFDLDRVVYSTFVSCYSERAELGWHIKNSYSIVLTGCGSEYFNQILKVENSNNIEVHSIYSGMPGMDGHVSSQNDFIFEFYNVDGGFFNGTQTDQAGNIGHIYFEGTTNFQFSKGSMNNNQIRYHNSKITKIGNGQTHTPIDMEFFIDPINGDDKKYSGRLPETAYQTLNALWNRIPDNIQHDIKIYVLGDVAEEFIVPHKKLLKGGKLSFYSRNNAELNITNLENMSDFIHFLDFNFSKPLRIYNSKISFYNCTFDMEDTEALNMLRSTVEFISCNLGAKYVKVNAFTTVLFSDTTSTRPTWGEVVSSIVYMRNSTFSGTPTLYYGGQVLE